MFPNTSKGHNLVYFYFSNILIRGPLQFSFGTRVTTRAIFRLNNKKKEIQITSTYVVAAAEIIRRGRVMG